MKKKILFSAILIGCLGVYVISFVATKKPFPEDPCRATASYWFQKDSLRRYSYLQTTSTTDSLLILADTTFPVNWITVCDTLCTIYKDSCKRTGVSVLVVNYKDTARSTWDTRFGRKILFRVCL